MDGNDKEHTQMLHVIHIEAHIDDHPTVKYLA